ncbi:hypothetical protein SRHO_G00094690 [Serrasalmus rhombeus]
MGHVWAKSGPEDLTSTSPYMGQMSRVVDQTQAKLNLPYSHLTWARWNRKIRSLKQSTNHSQPKTVKTFDCPDHIISANTDAATPSLG